MTTAVIPVPNEEMQRIAEVWIEEKGMRNPELVCLTNGRVIFRALDAVWGSLCVKCVAVPKGNLCSELDLSTPPTLLTFSDHTQHHQTHQRLTIRLRFKGCLP
jgi:hypothetical protein